MPTGADPQSLEPGTHPRRVQQRLCGRRGHGNVPGGPGVSDRGLRPPAGLLLRRGRLKPTYGRISRYGVLPFSWSLDHVGLFTRTVSDAALLLNVLAGYDTQDPTTSREPVPDYTRAPKSSRAPFIGVVEEFYRKNSEAQVWKNTDEVLARLKKTGAKWRR